MEEISTEIIPIDVENYKHNEEVEFSHQALVMSCMRKCIEAGCKEMKPGYWNDRSDRFGNILKVYIPDTRKEFIESVKNLDVIMSCDFDTTAEEKIKEIKERLENEFKRLCEMEKKEWEFIGKATEKSRHLKGIFFQSGTLNVNLSYYQQFLEFSVNIHREILRELTLLTKRIGFYAVEDVKQTQ